MVCEELLMLKKGQLLALMLLFITTTGARLQSNSPPASSIERAALSAEVSQFLNHELAAHLGDISSLAPPPTRVQNAGTTGEYTWGTSMRAIAAYAEMSGKGSLGGHDLARLVGQIGMLEHRLGSTRFSQLYAAQTL